MLIPHRVKGRNLIPNWDVAHIGKFLVLIALPDIVNGVLGHGQPKIPLEEGFPQQSLISNIVPANTLMDFIE